MRNLSLPEAAILPQRKSDFEAMSKASRHAVMPPPSSSRALIALRCGSLMKRWTVQPDFAAACW